MCIQLYLAHVARKRN